MLTRRGFRDGWANSCDTGFTDADGYLYITDGATDIVIRGSEINHPLGIERTLMGRSVVLQTGVFSLPEDRWRKEPALAVCLREPRSPREAQAREFLARGS